MVAVYVAEQQVSTEAAVRLRVLGAYYYRSHLVVERILLSQTTHHIVMDAPQSAVPPVIFLNLILETTAPIPR